MRTTIRILVWSAALLLASTCYSQTYPARPVRAVVPYAAGGPTDVIARVVAQKLSESLGQQFLVENLPGAGFFVSGRRRRTTGGPAGRSPSTR